MNGQSLATVEGCTSSDDMVLLNSCRDLAVSSARTKRRGRDLDDPDAATPFGRASETYQYQYYTTTTVPEACLRSVRFSPFHNLRLLAHGLHRVQGLTRPHVQPRDQSVQPGVQTRKRTERPEKASSPSDRGLIGRTSSAQRRMLNPPRTAPRRPHYQRGRVKC